MHGNDVVNSDSQFANLPSGKPTFVLETNTLLIVSDVFPTKIPSGTMEDVYIVYTTLDVWNFNEG